jgi:very-short-patch-repair endonuclease
MNVRELAARQYDVVAAWQLLDGGWSRSMIKHRLSEHGWRRIHRGVYALTSAPVTRQQLWMAATLTAPGTVLSHASAAACWGFRPWEGRFETVTRPGSGGPKRVGAVLIARSGTLSGEVARGDEIAITTPVRTLIDLAAHLDDRALGRAFREAIRLRTTTAQEVQAALARHPTRRGTSFLRGLAIRYAELRYERARSDAESRALELLRDARLEEPRVNARVAGEEADLSWPDRKLIVEIDGPQYHRFPEDDAGKESRWRAAGYTVRRIRSDDVYGD